MKKTIAVLFAMASAAVFATAGVDSLVVTFSTPGPDKYADGNLVLDGECYALVYTKDGVHEPVITVSAAQNGKCMPVHFELSEGTASKYTGGEWGVFLLDTRDFVKDPSGQTLSGREAKTGKPNVVNVTAPVAEGVASAGMSDATAATGVASGAYDLAAAKVPQPIVTGIQVVGANVDVTVANTVPFVGYTIQSGNDVKNFSIPSGTKSSAGDSAGDIKLVAPKGDGAQFFKISTIQ